jgi:hypothetical protein
MDSFPDFDHQLSPLTGWTRAHWVALLARMTDGYARAAERSGSAARALYPDDRRGLPDTADALESYARMASAWGAWLHEPSNPAVLAFDGRENSIEALMRQALLDGTDPAKPHTYWGDMDHMDQRLVESTDFAASIWMSRERVFDKLTAEEQQQIMRWLAQVDGKGTYYDNWVLFPAVAQAVRLRLGFPVDVAELDRNLDQGDDFYRGDGWYVDGPANEYELYNAWMFNWHFLLWAWIDGDRRPDLRQRVLERARSFLAGWQYFFGANGSYAAWGRSLVYRFAAVSAFATGYLLKVAPADPGMLRRLSSGCLRYFYDRDACDPHGHFLRQGFHGDFPPAGESYISPGSPSWACHGLFALMFGADDPFWTAVESPLPVERDDFDLALPAPGFVLRGRRATGQVILLNSRSGHAPDVARGDYVPKYGKLAYTSHFPFNVVAVAGSYAPDAMLALTTDGCRFGHRATTRQSGAAPGMIWSEFDELVDGQPQLLRVAVMLWNDVQLRLTFVQPTRPVRVVEAPGALGCARAAAIVRRSNPHDDWEYAQADERALAIRKLYGYDSQSASAPFLGSSNINLAYPYAELPMVCEARANQAPRGLAAVSLLRPAAFDPAAELSGFAVTAEAPDSFHVTFPDGERAFARLGDAVKAIRLCDRAIEGAAIQVARIQPGLAALAGLGVSRVAGVVELRQPGAFALSRSGDGAVYLTTDTGAALAREWMGGAPDRIEVLTPQAEWVDVPASLSALAISSELVREWSECTNRTLVTFRLRR